MLQYLKLLDRFVSKVLQQAADHVILLITAVNIHIDLPTITTAESDSAHVSLGRIERAGWPSFWRDDRKISEGSIQQRQILDFTGRNTLGDFRSRSFNRSPLRSHLHGGA